MEYKVVAVVKLNTIKSCDANAGLTAGVNL